MPYLIDGHNLIPKLPGLSLRSEDDEMQLVERLQVFCRIRRQKVEVFFDRAAPGHAGRRSFGQVSAIFVPQGQTADQAIHRRLEKLGQSARTWKVVSSDREVQSSARLFQAESLSAETFARMLNDALIEAETSGSTTTRPMSEAEVEEWLRLFQQKRPKK
jgi:predicted RNA-binding protein with PIN domain